MENKYHWVTYAKGIGIILVVYGHVARGIINAGLPLDLPIFKMADSVIYTFHMPLFFFLSGIFFHDSFIKRGSLGLVANKLDSIIYPYVVWSLLQGMCEVLLSGYTNGDTTLAEVFSFAWKPRAQFWFLYALFQIFLVWSLIYAWIQNISAFRSLLFSMVLYLLASPLSDSINIAGYVTNNAPFFTLGIFFNEIKSAFEKRKTFLVWTLGGLFLSGQYLFHVTFGLHYLSGGMGKIALATISIFLVVAAAMHLSTLRANGLAIIGTYSMSIYLMHILAASGSRVIFKKLFGVESVIAHLIIGTAIGIGAPLLAHFLIRKYKLLFLLQPPDLISASHILERRAKIAGQDKAPV